MLITAVMAGDDLIITMWNSEIVTQIVQKTLFWIITGALKWTIVIIILIDKETMV
jgi:hypothetical protein